MGQLLLASTELLLYTLCLFPDELSSTVYFVTVIVMCFFNVNNRHISGVHMTSGQGDELN